MIVEPLSCARLRANRGEVIGCLAAEKGSDGHDADINGSSIQVIYFLWLPSCNSSQKYKFASYSRFRPAASPYGSHRGSFRLHSASDDEIFGRAQPSSAGRRCFSARKRTGHLAVLVEGTAMARNPFKKSAAHLARIVGHFGVASSDMGLAASSDFL